MPTVTAISSQKRNPDRYNLFIDGAFFCGVDLETITNWKLRINTQVNQVVLDQVFMGSQIALVYAKALDYLSVRPRSQKEMEQYLVKKIKTSKHLKDLEENEMHEQIKMLIQRLEKHNYINDSEFTEWWINQRVHASKPSSLRKITAELYQKGVDKKTIDRVWRELDLDTSQVLQEYYEKIQHRYDLSSQKDKKRLTDHLLRRGFNWEDIKHVLK